MCFAVDNWTFRKKIKSIYEEFEEYIKTGGFPGVLNYDNKEDQQLYVKNVIIDIFEKDIRQNSKIKDKEMFESIEKYIINNFGAEISVNSIVKYYEGLGINIDYRTVEKYVDVLTNAKIIYPCENFDIKSKQILSGEKNIILLI